MLSRSKRVALVAVSVTLAHCGALTDAPPDAGSTVDPAPDAGSTVDGAAPVARLFRFGYNDLCLPIALPTSVDGGGPLCHVVLSGVAGDCNQPGLVPASFSDAAAIIATLQADNSPQPPGTLCALQELDGANCTPDTSPGWCYVHESCWTDAGRPCDQTICASAGFLVEDPTYLLSWLICP
jgi:hypothetical protein